MQYNYLLHCINKIVQLAVLFEGKNIMTVISTIFALLSVLGEATTPVDTSFTLRYDLPVGMSYTYQVITDQYILKTAGVRLHTLIIMDVIGHDENSHSVCRFRLKSDTVGVKDQKFIYRPLTGISLAGKRLYAEAGHVELVMDALGRLVDNSPSVEELNSNPEIVTQFHRTVESNTNDPDLLGEGGSYMLQFIMPSLPKGLAYELRKAYVDTITFNSKSVHLPTRYGVGETGESAQSRLVLTDTLFRTTVLDSVRNTNNASYGYMTLTNMRTNALGGRFTSQTNVVRDMTSGVVNKVAEYCWKKTGDENRLAYFASAELIHSGPIGK